MTETQPASQVLRIRDPQYRDIYANNSQTNISPFDLSILFQKASEIAPGQMGVVDQVSVTLSPQHFKALLRSLNETLSAYESVFGELNISDTDTAPQRTALEIAGLVNDQRKARSAAISSSNEPPQPSKRSHGVAREKGP
jgi:Protein of unknown function (DUF3467)